MEKKLPKVFHNKIDKPLNNNNKYFYSSEIIKKEQPTPNIDNKSVRKKINEIFAAPNYIYKANVTIKLSNKTLNERIIGRNKNYLITMDNKTIPIDDIIDIETN